MTTKMKQELLDDGWINCMTYPVHNADENGVSHRSLGHTVVYRAWHGMKQRCTNKHYIEKYPTYIGVTASTEFKNFTKFHDWWYKQVGHDLPSIELDKDLLIKGNKVYSSENCLLIPSFVNKFLTKRDSKRGDCVIGVCKSGSYKDGGVKYRAKVMRYNLETNKTTQKHIGYFNSELDAFYAYKEAKEVIAKQYADYLQGKVDERVIQALLDFKVNIDD